MVTKLCDPNVHILFLTFNVIFTFKSDYIEFPLALTGVIEQ